DDEEKPVAGDYLLNWVEGVAEVPLRPAVDIHDNRILLGGIEVGRLEEPGFDGELAALYLEALPLGRRVLGQERCVVAGDDLCRAGLQVVDGKLAGRLEAGERLHNVAPGGVDAEAD